MRLYDEGARSGKHATWSLKDLKKGLLWVVDIGVQTGLCEGKHGKRKDEGSKCLDQGDGQDEGGTCIRPKWLCSKGEQGAMAIVHGKAKIQQMISWIGWQQWFGWNQNGQI